MTCEERDPGDEHQVRPASDLATPERRAARCTTHHAACDCRELARATVEAERDRLLLRVAALEGRSPDDALARLADVARRLRMAQRQLRRAARDGKGGGLLALIERVDAGYDELDAMLAALEAGRGGEFIAAAREAVPVLCVEVERLRPVVELLADCAFTPATDFQAKYPQYRTFADLWDALPNLAREALWGQGDGAAREGGTATDG